MAVLLKVGITAFLEYQRVGGIFTGTKKGMYEFRLYIIIVFFKFLFQLVCLLLLQQDFFQTNLN
jgi:hypothetical protein